MREIKFRAWLRDKKEWCCVLELHYDTHGTQFSAILAGKNVQYGIYGCHQYDLIENTGFKNKDDVEIFKGDIVRHINYKQLLWIGVNEVKQDAFGRWLPFGPHRKVTEELDILTILMPHEFETLGDVFENPELLK